MRHEQAYAAIQAAVTALHQKLGGRYQTCYLYGSLAQGFYQAGQSDVNLFFIFDDDTSIHAVREAFLPVWATHGSVLRSVPAVATETAFQRHMRLNPTFARHIAKHGKQVKGSKRILHQTSPLANKEHLARLTAKALEASMALAPNLIRTEARRERPLQQLRSLVRQIRKAPVDEEESAEALFTKLQQLLQRKTEEIYQLQEIEPLPGSTVFLNPNVLEDEAPPYDLPGLEAVYQKMDYLVLALESVDDMDAIDWAALEEELRPEYGGLQVTTPMQMRLIIKYEMPLEYILHSYRHRWGRRPLQNLEPESWRILRDAARLASQFQLFDLPAAYLSVPDDDQADEAIHKIVHDFQNKLLNIRLQNELLARTGHVTRSEPPMPLPDREDPLPKRITAILEHFDWWGAYYENAMMQAEAPYG